ncbi:MAG: hypothetical protein CO109_02520 [Deltaproteobacteria bacterium CG_4_9_14_3_um_filter_65_9]|nr:MAG: hypothetical protein CO109_02520 [Deltaproteobacteria bacterium CG_4_9_14_3_um_filter_65_9]
MTKVLIVDDQSENRYLLEALVRGFGYEAIVAENGVVALEAARRDPPDIVVSDILMPVMDGFTLCREWMKDERLRRVPFVFYTATYTGSKDRELAMKLGAARFLIKPMEPEEFIGIVRQVLQEHEAGRLVAPPGPVEEETVTHHLYNEALIRKLEKKSLEMENVRRDQEREIAWRRRVENALRESEDRYRDLVDHSTDTIYTHDLEGNVLSANEAAPKVTGYSLESLLRMNLRDLLDPKLRDGFDAYLAEIREKGRAAGVMRILTAAGDTRYWEFSNTLRTEGVAAPIVRGTARDVTDRILAEKALRKSEKQYQKLSTEFHATLDAIPDNITILSPGMTVVWANRATAAELKKEPADLIGCRCYTLMHNLDRPCEKCPVQRTFGTGKPDDGIIPVPDRRVLEVRAIPVMEDGRVVNVIEISRDITEFRRMEEHMRQSHKMEAVGRLAGGVAHDFNNMLNVILGYAEMALARLDPGTPLAGDLEEIRKAGQRSADLTRQLLAFSRKQIAVPKIINLSEVIAEQMNMLGRLVGEDLRIEFVPAGDSWNIRIDPTQLTQILANLAVNARDAVTGVGTITIETSNTTLDEAYCREHDYATPGEYAMFAVSDTGRGMDTAMLGRIFEPFFTTKEVGKGTGLGLATVYGIVKQNGGIVNVYSEPGMGTTFRIYFPREREESKEGVEPEKEAVPVGAETVLLVEDEEQILSLATRILEDQGYRVLSARSPEEACRIAERPDGKIDLLLTDVVMPGMNGKELRGRIAALRPGIKTLFMSGYTADAIAHRGVLDEGVAFVQKPFTIRSLAEMVRKVLDA